MRILRTPWRVRRTSRRMPRVCAQLAELTAQQAPDAAQLARLIQSDPALAGEIMRVANSPALRPRAPIVSLQQAVSWLGVAEVRNIAMAVMLRGEVFAAPGHEPESEELWREAWLAGLWAKEIARERRKHVESAFLAALMHRTGAALALKILSGFEAEQRTVMDAESFRGTGGGIRAALRPIADEQLAPARAMCRMRPATGATTANQAKRSGGHRACGAFAGDAHHASAAPERGAGVRESGVRAARRVSRRSPRDAGEARSVCAAWRACSDEPADFDLICLGSGPAGQKAAIQAAKAGFRAAIVEREPQVGGSCLLSGTIPSKALREQALRYRRMRGQATSFAVELRGDAPLVRAAAGRRRRHRRPGPISARAGGAQRGRIDSRQGRVPGRASHRSAASGRFAPRAASAARAARHRIAAAARRRHRGGSRAHRRQRFDLEPAVHSAIHDGARQRRHRLRVRVDIRRTRLRGDDARQGGGAAGLSRSCAARADFSRHFAPWAASYRGGAEVGGARFDGFSQVEVRLRGGETLARTSCSRRSDASRIWTASAWSGLELGISARGTCR